MISRVAINIDVADCSQILHRSQHSRRAADSLFGTGPAKCCTTVTAAVSVTSVTTGQPVYGPSAGPQGRLAAGVSGAPSLSNWSPTTGRTADRGGGFYLIAPTGSRASGDSGARDTSDATPRRQSGSRCAVRRDNRDMCAVCENMS